MWQPSISLDSDNDRFLGSFRCSVGTPLQSNQPVSLISSSDTSRSSFYTFHIIPQRELLLMLSFCSTIRAHSCIFFLVKRNTLFDPHWVHLVQAERQQCLDLCFTIRPSFDKMVQISDRSSTNHLQIIDDLDISGQIDRSLICTI